MAKEKNIAALSAKAIDISATHKEIVQEILREHLANSCHVWVFGSRATWLAKEYSDLDLAIERKDGSALSLTVMSAIETAFEDSLLPWKVDVIDLNSVSEEFREAIERDKVLFSLGVGGEWNHGYLSDIADIVMGQSPPGNLCNSVNGIYLLNGPTEFGSHHPKPVQFTTDPKKFSEIGDILFCVRGSTTGRMNWANQRYAIGRGIAAIRHKNGLLVQPYLHALIKHNLKTLLVSATGSTFPNVSKDQLFKLNISIPPLPEQKAIAHILGTLDDKIELNRQTNQTLEAMAQALFQSWFVDFDPVIDKALAAGNEIPEAFQAKAAARKALGDQRLALPEDVTALFPDSFVFTEEMGWIPEGWEVKKFNVKIVPKDSVILSFKLTLGRVSITQSELTTNEAIAHFIDPKFHISKEYIYCYLLNFNYDLLGNTSSIATAVNSKIIKTIPFLVPQKTVLKMFEKTNSSWFEKINIIINQTQKLTDIRDTLLPKLISGELRIADAGELINKDQML